MFGSWRWSKFNWSGSVHQGNFSRTGWSMVDELEKERFSPFENQIAGPDEQIAN